MKHYRFLLSSAAFVLALLAVNPAMQAATRKARPAQKEHTAKTVPATQQDNFQKHVDQEITSLKDDVYTRATWKKLEEVKQEADETKSTMKLVTFSAAGIGLILGCVITFLVMKRMGGSDDGLKIT